MKLKNGADDYGFDDLDITNFIIKGTCVTTEHWRRVRRDKPCPICGRPDWCLISTDDTAAICARVQSERRIGEAGFLHRLQERQPSVTRRVRSVYLPLSSNSKLHLAELVGRYQAAVHDAELCKLAKRLGLTVDGLRALRIGWTGTAWSFPMTNVAGAVLGVRLRSTEGRKFAVKGGEEGLFIPSSITPTDNNRLLITEGPTDTAALLDLGFATVVGRPSCNGGLKLLVHLVQQWRCQDVVIVADSDEPGQRGAGNLASVLAVYVPNVRAIRPPDGIKDARAWVQAGGTRQEVEQAIQDSHKQRLTIRMKEVHHGR